MEYLLSGNTFYIKDLKFHTHGRHPPTFGEVEIVDGKRQAKEKVLTLLDE